ncbi:17762_t:CDS:2 [Funneliformis caledonium]|uniref:17762_t:CDS:1 n=1 Tax=Funneliformis caledonium TaxID=1117310 RepID=A0A9N8VC67_9GLOM|nr:17762_t:CDS:2 [Funneliformis caledonium]
MIENNYVTLDALAPIDQNYAQPNYDFQDQTKKCNHVYSKFTIPSITSIISQPSSITDSLNVTNFIIDQVLQQQSSLSNNAFSITPSSIISPISSQQTSPMELDFNCNSHLLTQSQLQNSIQSSSNSLSYFVTPDKDTTISLQDIIDGTKVMQEISKDSTIFDLGLTNCDMDLNENSIEWLLQDSCPEMSKPLDTCQSLTEKEPVEECRRDIDDLIEEHMKEMKKFIHNEILCQEILTEPSCLEFQDLPLDNLEIETDCSSTSSTSTAVYLQEGICQEADGLLSTTNMFMPQEDNFSYDALAIEETPNLFSTNLLETHKATHINDEIFLYNDLLGCDMKFESSDELIKYQLDYLN